MPTVLKIELDASKAERDLAQFRAKVEALKTLESQPAEKTISVKVETKGATAAIARTGKELKAATVPAETFRTRASAAFRNVWKDLSDGEGLVKNLTGALKGVLSPVGAIGLGMAALGWETEKTDRALTLRLPAVSEGEYQRICSLLEKTVYGGIVLEPFEERALDRFLYHLTGQDMKKASACG